jgi:hypothetical protein
VIPRHIDLPQLVLAFLLQQALERERVI